MVSRNILRVDVADSFYHVYARGVNKRVIFRDTDDFTYFLHLLKRYLSPEDIRSSAGVSYEKLGDDLELVCYCLMKNHFHLLVYQKSEKALERLMRGVMTAYSRYFNVKYQRRGPLFESRYKASRITKEDYLQHITRYIHLNPQEWRTYPYSSLSLYLTEAESDFVHPGKALSLFPSATDYLNFVSDYEAVKEDLKIIKYELAEM